MVNSVLLQNFEKNDKINNQIFSRNVPSNELEPNFSPRPVSTKYSTMKVVDNRSESNVPLKSYEYFNTQTTFFPGTDKPKYCGFSRNVDKESTLRNQFFALQKSNQCVYVPSSNSDLYENPINFLNTNKNLDETLLFREEVFNDKNPNPSNLIGSSIFNNATRVQLKKIK